jgi:hypothetical protein
MKLVLGDEVWVNRHRPDPVSGQSITVHHTLRSLVLTEDEAVKLAEELLPDRLVVVDRGMLRAFADD